jgi:hypothetical protein
MPSVTSVRLHEGGHGTASRQVRASRAFAAGDHHHEFPGPPRRPVEPGGAAADRAVFVIYMVLGIRTSFIHPPRSFGTAVRRIRRPVTLLIFRSTTVYAFVGIICSSAS